MLILTLMLGLKPQIQTVLYGKLFSISFLKPSTYSVTVPGLTEAGCIRPREGGVDVMANVLDVANDVTPALDQALLNCSNCSALPISTE